MMWPDVNVNVIISSGGGKGTHLGLLHYPLHLTLLVPPHHPSASRVMLVGALSLCAPVVAVAGVAGVGVSVRVEVMVVVMVVVEAIQSKYLMLSQIIS